VFELERREDSEVTYDIYIVSAEGGEPQNVTKDIYTEQGSSWSPDGSRIVFSSDRGGNFDLWTLELATDTNPTTWGRLKLLYSEPDLEFKHRLILPIVLASGP
jgi:Tol biopolymer transport system component